MYRLDRHLLFQIAKKLSLTDLLNFCSCNKEINRKLECSIWDYLITLSLFDSSMVSADYGNIEISSKKQYYILLFNLNQIKKKFRLKETLHEIYIKKELPSRRYVLTKFPKEICRLQYLQSLNLYIHQIKKIPKEIFLLKNLKI